MSNEPPVIETGYECGTYSRGTRSTGYFPFRSKGEADDWASERRTMAEREGRSIFHWYEAVPPDFSGLAVEEIWFMKAEGKRTRLWAMPDGIAPRRDPAPGIPSEILPARCTRTSYEVRTVKGGKPTAISEICETPN